MTITEARKILGEESINISDEDLEKDIHTAEILKNLFFSQLHKKEKTNKHG